MLKYSKILTIENKKNPVSFKLIFIYLNQLAKYVANMSTSLE